MRVTIKSKEVSVIKSIFFFSANPSYIKIKKHYKILGGVKPNPVKAKS
jgi:hypothetical protein